MEPTIRPYGNYKANNYGTNAMQVDLGPLILWFSYRDLIAFRRSGDNVTYTIRNQWGSTTGKHLRWVREACRTSQELPPAEFQELLASQLRNLLSPAST